MPDVHDLLEPVLDLHGMICHEVADAAERDPAHALARVSRQDTSDTIYAIDRVAEGALANFAGWLREKESFVLIAEGLPGGTQVWPEGTAEADAMVDP